jgi:hypothetical protein
MPARKKENGDDIRISINNSPISAGHDFILKGKESRTTSTGDIGADATVVQGDDTAVDAARSGLDSGQLAELLTAWREKIEARIEAQVGLLEEDKQDLKETVAKIEAEAAKAEQAQPGRLERLINSLAAMGPDIFEVAVATLANPLSGIGLALKKISDKAATVKRAGQDSGEADQTAGL